MITIDTVDNEASKANTNPTEAQKEAGNYKMGHISVKGMKIAIENPKGSKRYYAGGRKYNVMQNHYGYFNITKGKDGDAVDVFLGPDIENFQNVYCVDQNKANGEFDETKVMLGFGSKEEAKDAYLSNYDENWTGFRDITSVSIKDFKKWLYRGRKQRQPFADYVYIQKKKLDEMKKNMLKEWGDDAADMMGMYDSGYDGPTNEPDVMDTIYDRAMRVIRKTGDFEGEINEVSDAVMEVMDELEANNGFPNKLDDCIWLVASKAVQKIDPVYYEEEFSLMMEGRKVIRLTEGDVQNIIKNAVRRYLNENKLTRDDDFTYPEKQDDEYLDAQYEKWKSEQPTQKDWDDFGFWASSDEPDLVNDEIGAAHDREHPVYPIDADDEGEGYSRDYQAGVEYAQNLIAKSRVPEGMIEKLNEKEDAGTISAFELGILDTLDEG